jgi:hypothetical protein
VSCVVVGLDFASVTQIAARITREWGAEFV